MALVNVSVYYNAPCSPTIPWTIHQVEDDRITLKQLFELVTQTLERRSRGRIEARIGKTKENLDAVNSLDLRVVPLVSTFGNYIKFYVNNQQERQLTPSISAQCRNAFEVLMSAAVQQASIKFPKKIVAMTKKDELYNAILEWIIKEGLCWQPAEVENGTAKNTIRTLQDVLWYLDDHHATLAERSCHVPSVFSQFVGYNQPEKSKHRKRLSTSLSSDVLRSHSQRLFGNLQCSFWSRSHWCNVKAEVEILARSVGRYAELLTAKKSRITSLHNSSQPARSVGNDLTIEYLKSRLSIPTDLLTINQAVVEAGCHVAINLQDILPQDRRKRYDVIQHLKCGLSSTAVLLTYTPGSNLGNSHWIWFTNEDSISSVLKSCQPIIEDIKKELPVYHTRAMRKAVFEKFGLVTPNVKKSVLRHFYRDLTADQSGSSSLSEQEVDERLCALFELEEPDLIYDLRAQNSGRPSDRFQIFRQKAKDFLEEDVGTAVDDRRHSQVVHLAKAISVCDFRQQVKQRCPPEVSIPCDELIRLQFIPAHISYKSASRYTACLQVKRMVQHRQWRMQHEDSHYAACIFRYMREYAVRCQRFSRFVSLDDKHKVKVGHPGSPVAAAERGRQVLVHSSSSFQVGDHDFTNMSITPSVSFVVDIAENINESWYDGLVHVLFKDSAFEPSSPCRHAAELDAILQPNAMDYPVLFLYTDGGPDHRLTYASVKLTLIALFLKLNLDYLCVSRTAPHHSYRNPAERVMSVINLGLQSIGLSRRQLEDEVEEQEVRRCGSVSEVRELASKKPGLKESLIDSMSPVKVTLTNIANRLEWKGRSFSVDVAATTENLTELWSTLNEIDSEFKFTHTDKITRKGLSATLQSYLRHCCRERHYFFDIKKCGDSSCNMCKPPCLPVEEFTKLKHLPDPMIAADGHYKKFDEVFGTSTTEEQRPSLQKITKKRLPFYPSVQHVNNVKTMLMCDECGMWRLVYATKKLKTAEIRKLRTALDDLSFSCGASLQEANIPLDLKPLVYVKSMHCNEPIEKLYYSAKFEDICIYCAASVPPWSDSEPHYPQCDDCIDKPKIPTNKKS